MELKICDFETCKKLHEIGFDLITDDYYSKSGKWTDGSISDIIIGRKAKYSAPNHALAQAWLREKHRINIEITFNKRVGWCYAIKDMNDVYPEKLQGKFESFEKALEEAIKQTCIIIKKRKK